MIETESIIPHLVEGVEMFDGLSGEQNRTEVERVSHFLIDKFNSYKVPLSSASVYTSSPFMALLSRAIRVLIVRSTNTMES
jgi:hypothetical protein